jgi:hypothetical protein
VIQNSDAGAQNYLKAILSAIGATKHPPPKQTTSSLTTSSETTPRSFPHANPATPGAELNTSTAKEQHKHTQEQNTSDSTQRQNQKQIKNFF